MYYVKKGSGPVLVLIHGFPDSGEIWEPLASVLSEYFTLIMPDLPGSGNSELKGDTSLAEMAAGLKKILDAEGINKAVIAGHSMGGYTGLAFARLYPEAVAGFSLIHSTPKADDEEKKVTRQKAIELIRKGGKEAFIKQMTTKLFAPSFAEANPEVVKDKVAMGMKISEEGLINFYKAIMERNDNTEIVTKAPFPMQWIMGMEDGIVNYKKNLELCYHSTINFVTLYSNCGHISMIEQPENLLINLKQFANYCNR